MDLDFGLAVLMILVGSAFVVGALGIVAHRVIAPLIREIIVASRGPRGDIEAERLRRMEERLDHLGVEVERLREEADFHRQLTSGTPEGEGGEGPDR